MFQFKKRRGVFELKRQHRLTFSVEYLVFGPMKRTFMFALLLSSVTPPIYLSWIFSILQFEISSFPVQIRKEKRPEKIKQRFWSFGN